MTTVRIDVATTPVPAVYQMLVGLVAPRPIAWVTTISPAGIVNLAPFSFFNAFGANPPVVVISPTLTRAGKKKDTLLNIDANGEFVVNATTERHAAEINLSSRPLPYDESEIDLTGLATAPSVRVRPPRVAAAPFALECRTLQIVPVGHGPIAANLVIAEVLSMHVDEAVLDAQGQPNPRKIAALGRLGGEHWCRTTDLFQMERPT